MTVSPNKCEELNKELCTPEYKVMQMLSETQKQILDKFRSEGTGNFTRNDYQVLATIRKNCRYIIENYDEAKKIYLELTK